MHIPDYAKGKQELWTPRLMREALVYAIRVMSALPGGGFSNAAIMPDFNDDWGYADASQNETRLRPKAEDISRMELLLIGRGHRRGLLNASVLGYREHRRVLILWAKWVAYGTRDLDGEIETEWDFSVRHGMTEATMKRYRDFAAGIMSDQANRDGIAVWHVDKPRRRRRRMGILAAAGSI